MSDDRDVLKDYYKQYSESGCNFEDLEEQFENFLKKNDTDVCFKLLPFNAAQEVFKKKIGNNRDWCYLEFAMENLEKYTLNLMTKPWCKDFCTIKIFTGFFRYNIEQWISLKIACKILELIGYHRTAPGIFSRDVDKPVDDRVLVVSFELCLARVLTKLYRSGDVLKLMKHNDCFENQRQISNLRDSSIRRQTEELSRQTEELLRQTAVNTLEYKTCYDKDGHTTDLIAPGIYNNTTQEHESLGVNPSDLDDELLYGKNDSSGDDSELSNGFRGNVYQNGQDGYNVHYDLTEKDERNTHSELYENITSSNKMIHRYEPHNFGTAQGKKDDVQYGQGNFTTQDHYRQYNTCNPDLYQNINPNTTGPYSSMPVRQSTDQYCAPAMFNFKGDSSLKEKMKSESYIAQQPILNQLVLKQDNDINRTYENVSAQRYCHTSCDKAIAAQLPDDVLLERAGRIDEIMKKRIKGGERALGQKPLSVQHFGSTAVDSFNKQNIVCTVCSNHEIVVFCENCEVVYCQNCFKLYGNTKCLIGRNNDMHVFKQMNKETLSSMESFPQYC